MKRKKKRIPKPRNIMAMQLQEPQYKPKTVRMKTIYKRINKIDKDYSYTNSHKNNMIGLYTNNLYQLENVSNTLITI